MDNPTAANVLGTMGAVCWSIQLLPQILLNARRKSTLGLQPTMMLLWSLAGLPLGTYNIASRFTLPLLIQPQILTSLSLITWAQCKYYSDNWSVCRILSFLAPIGVVMAGVQLGLVFALRRAEEEKGLQWPKMVMAVLAACLLCLGVLRHYVDIWCERTVRGISFVFVALDALGDLASLLSILFEPKLDILGIVIYASELTLWLGVFACGGWYNLVPWARRKRSQLRRSQRDEAVENADGQQELDDMGTSTGVEDTASTRSHASSRSVFRTASRHSD